MEVTCIHFERK